MIYSKTGNGRINQIDPQDRAIHDWYRFVLSFPPHLVRDYIADFNLSNRSVLLDPFCGTGTTLVEAKLLKIQSIGIEANLFAHFATQVKVNWEINPEELLMASRKIAKKTISTLESQGILDESVLNQNVDYTKLRKLSSEQEKLILTNSISSLPLHKALVLIDHLNEYQNKPYYGHLALALANILVFSVSNLHFGPEVGVSKPKYDAAVVNVWLNKVQEMYSDLLKVSSLNHCKAIVHLSDSRQISGLVEPSSIDAVITSPPYPNEKDYTRTTRLESVLLGFIKDKEDLRELKKSLIRSNTRNVYKGDNDNLWVENNSEITQISEEIEKRRVELGKTSGFERLYGTVTKLYFGGMSRHLESLRTVLRPGAKLAYVVGDQASYLRVMIRTGKILSDLAKSLGYEVVRIDLFRTRFASATKSELREEVVILRWPG